MATAVHDPLHPGVVMLKDSLKPFDIEPDDLAKRLGVAPSVIDQLIAGKSSITADLALRLSVVLQGSAESWLQLQTNYDFWQAQQDFTAHLTPYDWDDMVSA